MGEVTSSSLNCSSCYNDLYPQFCFLKISNPQKSKSIVQRIRIYSQPLFISCLHIMFGVSLPLCTLLFFSFLKHLVVS